MDWFILFYFLSEANVGFRGRGARRAVISRVEQFISKTQAVQKKCIKLERVLFHVLWCCFPRTLQVNTWYCFSWHEKLKALLTYMQCTPSTSFKVMTLFSIESRLSFSFAATLSQIFMSLCPCSPFPTFWALSVLSHWPGVCNHLVCPGTVTQIRAFFPCMAIFCTTPILTWRPVSLAWWRPFVTPRGSECAPSLIVPAFSAFLIQIKA